MPRGGKRTSDKTKHLLCIHCSKDFVFSGLGAPPKYCSDMCRKEAALISRGHQQTCHQCGKTFTSLKATALYCSKKCSAKSRPKKPVNNYIKTCTVCEKSFATKDPSKKCCSAQCGLEAGHIASKKRKKYYYCQYCGNEFWRPNAFRMKYCSKECEWSTRRQAAEERNKNKVVIEKELYHRSCAYCGKEFETSYSNKIYCNDDCCYNGNLLMKRKQWADTYTPRTFVCKECGTRVTTDCGDTRKEFCCQTCTDKYNRRIEHKTERHRAYQSSYKKRRENQLRSAFVEHVSYKKLYERDHGICQICGLPVLYDKHADESWGATVDHVVPLSKGGLHSMSNCQLAHRICNSLKSDNDLEGFSISWANKANENNYWMQKYQAYQYLMSNVS